MTGFASSQDVQQLKAQIRNLEAQVIRLRRRGVELQDDTQQVRNRLTELWNGRAVRRTSVLLPLLSLGIPTDVTFMWRQPFPDTDYSLEPDWPIPANIQFSVKEKNPGNAIITLTATAVLPLNLSITLGAWK